MLISFAKTFLSNTMKKKRKKKPLNIYRIKVNSRLTIHACLRCMTDELAKQINFANPKCSRMPTKRVKKEKKNPTRKGFQKRGTHAHT